MSIGSKCAHNVSIDQTYIDQLYDSEQLQAFEIYNLQTSNQSHSCHPLEKHEAPASSEQHQLWENFPDKNNTHGYKSYSH